MVRSFAALLALLAPCALAQPAPEVRLVIVDPAHFHAALVQKEMYRGVSSSVAVYAPLGFDLLAHLGRVARFNLRAENPSDWRLDIRTGPDFFERMLRERPGNVVVLSGRNRAKFDRIRRSVEAGLHVLADKPWTLDGADVPGVARVLAEAAQRRLVAYDIMTERYEVTSILQRELVNAPEVFGAVVAGDARHPGVTMESVHRLMKTVAGVPNLRPTWFFDIDEQGEALADVGTHLVDLAQWSICPDQPIDYRRDVHVLDGRRWPTRISREQWRRVTGEAEFPASLAPLIHEGALDYYCNNSVDYTLHGVFVRLNVLWDFEGPPASDSYTARFRGSRATVEVRQGEAERYRPEVYVVPARPELAGAVGTALRARVNAFAARFDGLGVEEGKGEFRLTIPERHRVGHEEHFAQVMRKFLNYVAAPETLPSWETGYMLAKYYVTTRGVELARQRGKRP
jgi:predicted dehydrogenase